MFRKGTYQFNREPNFNFQLNRVVMWGNGDPEEVLSVSEGITDLLTEASAEDWLLHCHCSGSLC